VCHCTRRVDPVVLYRVLLYARPETRRRVVEEAAAARDQHGWDVLATTLRSPGPSTLRARCLEALGVAAATAEAGLADHILRLVCGSEADTVKDEAEPLLSPRQQEIAELIACGLSNREIADRLGLSRGTVGSHVQQVLRKLGVARRAGIGAWVGTHRQGRDNSQISTPPTAFAR
jgi:DNA-binding CsgD family transcriptional regulator